MIVRVTAHWMVASVIVSVSGRCGHPIHQESLEVLHLHPEIYDACLEIALALGQVLDQTRQVSLWPRAVEVTTSRLTLTARHHGSAESVGAFVHVPSAWDASVFERVRTHHLLGHSCIVELRLLLLLLRGRVKQLLLLLLLLLLLRKLHLLHHDVLLLVVVLLLLLQSHLVWFGAAAA